MAKLGSLVAAAEQAQSAYLAEPGTATLLPYLQAWDAALLALDGDTDLTLQAEVVHRAAVAHLQAYRRLGRRGDAEIAGTLLERLRRHAPSPELAFGATADLATLLLARYLVEGGLSRLRAAVAGHEDVLRRCPDGFALRPVLLDGLGNALVELARRDRTAEVLDRAVTLHDEAVATVAPDAPFRTALRVNLATALVARYQSRGALAARGRGRRGPPHTVPTARRRGSHVYPGR